MASDSIHLYGDPILRTRGEAVREFGPPLVAIGEAMIKTMHKANGIGLAAPQFGLALQLFVVDVDDPEHPIILDGKKVPADLVMPLVLANPKLTILEGPAKICSEGCLSFPGITGEVERIEKVRVDYSDTEGKPHALEAQGLLARCLQHEFDHCQGVLFIDRMTRAHQILVASKVKKLQRQTAAELKALKKKNA